MPASILAAVAASAKKRLGEHPAAFVEVVVDA
jgi:hypothetical protein